MTLSEIVKQVKKQAVVSIGINMNCDQVLSKGFLVFENGKIHYESGSGIKMKVYDISDFLTDTPDNRKFLKNKIKNQD